jgi:hypothetical protein
MDNVKSNKQTSATDKELSSSSEYEIPISDNFKLNAKKKLGSGAFGDIYYGIINNFDFRN